MQSLGKKTLIASAVAAALGTSSAFAVVPATNPGANIFYSGGGSAQANAFYVAACKLFGGNMDVYTSVATGGLDGSYYVMYGQVVNPAAGASMVTTALPVNTPVLFFYKFNGGSFTNGIAPEAGLGIAPNPAGKLQFPTYASIAATAAPIAGQAQGGACTSGLPTYTYTPTLDAGDVPDFGVSDVEVSMFSGFNNPTGNAGKNAQNTSGGAAPGGVTVDGIYDNLFGVAVTDKLYSAPAGSPNAGHPKTNFTRAEVEGIIAGTISDWGQLFADDGTPEAAGGIIFLDRTEGSGTKASDNQYFLGYPGSGTNAKLPKSVTGNYCFATVVGDGSQTILACEPGKTNATLVEKSIDVAEASTNAVIADLENANGSNIRAIAILGLENPPAKNLVGGAIQYEFTKVNGIGVDAGVAGNNINQIGAGASTSYNNVINGTYDFYYQNSFNTNGTTPPAGQHATNATAFKSQMTQASFVGCNAGGAFPTALPGTLVDPDTLAPVAKGVNYNTRNKLSPSPLQPHYDATSGAPPVCSDPI
jgi:hypothetical protein